jgi:antitoxin VapB
MTKHATGKIFMHGRSQAVRLPKEFRFEGNEVRIIRTEGGGVLLKPAKMDVNAVFHMLDAIKDDTFMADGRQQPDWPADKEIFD